MLSQLLFWAILLIMLTLSLFIGRLKGADNSIEWMSAKNSMSFIPIFGSIVGTMVGAAFFIALVIMGYENGILGIYIGIAYALGLSLLGLFSTKIRNLLAENNSHTLYHFLEKAFSKRVSFTFSLINLILFIFAIAGQILALKYFFIDNISMSMGRISIWAAIILVILVAVIYIFKGGLRKDIISDVIQLLIMVIALVFVLPVLKDVDSIEVNKIPKELYTVGTWGAVFFIGVLIMIAPMLLVRVDLWQRIIAAKSDRVAKLSFYTAAAVVCIFYWLFTLFGFLARGLGVDPDTNLIIGLLQRHPITSDMTIMAVSIAFICAVISTLDSLMNIAGISFVRVFYKSPESEEQTSLKNLRLATGIAIILSILISIIMPNIVDVFVSAISYVMVMSLPVILILLGFKKDERATFYSTISGALLLTVLIWIIPKFAFIPSVILGWVVYGAVALYTYKRVNHSETTQ